MTTILYLFQLRLIWLISSYKTLSPSPGCILCDSELNELFDVSRKLIRSSTGCTQSLPSSRQGPPPNRPTPNRPTPNQPTPNQPTLNRPPPNRPPPNQPAMKPTASESNDVFVTRSLNGAVATHGVPSATGYTVQNPPRGAKLREDHPPQAAPNCKLRIYMFILYHCIIMFCIL